MVSLDKHQCPRCGGPIPNAERVGQYPGVLSRDDNRTEVCSLCGMDEALRDGGLIPGGPLSRGQWFDTTGEPPVVYQRF